MIKNLKKLVNKFRKFRKTGSLDEKGTQKWVFGYVNALMDAKSVSPFLDTEKLLDGHNLTRERLRHFSVSAERIDVLFADEPSEEQESIH